MEEQGNENQEYTRQEVPRWQNQEPRMNIPSFSPPENEYGIPQQRGSKLGGGIGTIVITVIISLVLCYAMVSLLGISPSMKQYKADITRLELDLVDVRAVDAATNAKLDGLTNASIIAQNASTTATQAKELVATLQADYTSLNNALEVLETRMTELVSNSGDIYDDTIIRGLITAVEDKITAINTTITALQTYDTTNTTNLATLQTQIDDLKDDLADIQGNDSDDGSLADINERIDGIDDTLEDILDDLDDILKDGGYLDKMQGQIDSIEALALGKVSITDYTQGATYIKFKINEGGNYAIVVTLYGDSLGSVTITNTNNIDIISQDVYGTDKTMKILLIEPKQVGTPPVDANWATNLTFSLYLTSGASNIDYVEVDTAAR